LVAIVPWKAQNRTSEFGAKEAKNVFSWVSLNIPPHPAFVPQSVAISYASTPTNLYTDPFRTRFGPAAWMIPEGVVGDGAFTPAVDGAAT
jgi:hypothetical protein